ncbi:MAG: helix-turn-helix domain-containing protein [Oscillospiraceae bacterium]|nr:helix-turn-helix domain-containing protein [Oscillospiraceae bacterium]
MLNDNIKILRKNKGLTQEELSIRLNVVRQTVSKWEKGLSVPDAVMLQRIADVLDVSVNQLLGSVAVSEKENDAIVEQLARINEQLAVKNRRSRRIWKIIAWALIGIVGLYMVLLILSFTAFTAYRFEVPAIETTVVVEEQLVP